MNTIVSILLLFTNNTLHQDIYYCIAQYILEHLDEVEKISIGKLANDCGTSIATINKFCHLIGLDNFKSFKNLLINTRLGRQRQIKMRYGQLNEEEMFQQIQQLSHGNVTQENLKKNINEVVDLIHQSKHIYLIGATYPLALSLSFVEDMMVFHKSFTIKQLGYLLDDIQYNKDDLIIFITVTGRILNNNRQVFMSMYNTPAKKVVISQNKVFDDFYKFDNFIQLEGQNDDESMNLVIVEILNLIKCFYYKKYVNFFE